jgi:BirA family transcriptional regulator, biotin operon repressor / biotin---[acetyl-CoA-carboxylase] ligase
MMRKPHLPPAYRLITLDTVDSTNAEARRLAAMGEQQAPDGTLVWAQEQTAGRGRRGRKWHSPRGNLYCSLILRPEVPAEKAAQLSFVGALAVCDALSAIGPPGHMIQCKWPNDILLNGDKVGGLLLEAETGGGGTPDWVIMGLGINVAQHPSRVEFSATSLRASGWVVTEIDCLDAFSRHFMTWANTWLDQGFGAIRKNWLWRCKGIGDKIEVRLAKQTMKGIFKDIDQDGALLLKTGRSEHRITAGDVFFVAG